MKILTPKRQGFPKFTGNSECYTVQPMIVQLLVDYGANVNENSYYSPLYWSICNSFHLESKTFGNTLFMLENVWKLRKTKKNFKKHNFQVRCIWTSNPTSL